MLRRACAIVLSLSCLSDLAAAAPIAAPAAPADPVTASPWAGSGGELGFASAHGNSTTESLNAKLRGRYTDGDWIHSLDLTGLHTRARYTTTNDDGSVRRYAKTTANRYSGTAGSALQLGEHRQLTATLRYDRDDFATYDRVTTFGLGYGTRLVDRDRFFFDAQVGPGVRRAHDTVQDRHESGLIARGLFDLHYTVTGNTDLVNSLLVEAGSYNTFAQNDFGLSVSMNDHLALKAGWQMRHNTQVNDDSKKKTDTLTTMNVVYTFK